MTFCECGSPYCQGCPAVVRLKEERDAAMAACPWATHAETHQEPKDCIAALASLVDLQQKDIERIKQSVKDHKIEGDGCEVGFNPT